MKEKETKRKERKVDRKVARGKVSRPLLLLERTRASQCCGLVCVECAIECKVVLVVL